MPLRPDRPRTVFHIAAAEDWRRARESGAYAGSALCRRDGFIHMSTAAQLAGTLARFFAGRADIVLLAADAESLVPGLRWEDVPGAGVFPHYYGTLAVTRLRDLGPVILDPDGRHVLPDAVRERGTPA
jgi:uncharacterized protein (DUF952 family)